jgi:hypothetical protein
MHARTQDDPVTSSVASAGRHAVQLLVAPPVPSRIGAACKSESEEQKAH